LKDQSRTTRRCTKPKIVWCEIKKQIYKVNHARLCDNVELTNILFNYSSVESPPNFHNFDENLW